MKNKLKELQSVTKTNWFLGIQIALVILCTGETLLSDSYHMPYVMIAILSVYCMLNNSHNKRLRKRSDILITIGFSLLFALLVAFSNYRIWVIGGWTEVLVFLSLFIGAFVATYHLLSFIAEKQFCSGNQEVYKMKPRKVFLISFILIVAVNCTVLILCKYPGLLSPDSLAQLQQVLTGTYSNHHPVYHTLVIKLMIDVGLCLFHDINAAITCYMVFQICFMAMAFGFSVMTIYEAKAPLWTIVMLGLFYIIMPYHIMYSITMWKDVMFAGAALLYTLFLYRLFKSIGAKALNMIGLILAGIGFCLWRSNGLFAFMGATLVFVVLFRFKHKRMVIAMIAVIVGCFILKHPVLKSVGISQPDLAESLSIPLQQVARDVVENSDFTENETKLISRAVDTRRVPKVYTTYVSDPIKSLVRETGGQKVISKNKAQYLKLYLMRAAKHPATYVKAWIDQTRGYWNSGYSYWIWICGITENDMDLTNTVHVERINHLLSRYLSLYTEMPALHLFISIGLFVWALITLLYIAIVKRNKELAFLSVPSLMVIISLLIATPVFSEFRYAYAVICTMPTLAIIVLTHEDRVKA